MSRRFRQSDIGRKVELYSAAYKLAWEQISLRRTREQPNIPLRIHASIRRQLKDGAKNAEGIAIAALKDVLLPTTH